MTKIDFRDYGPKYNAYLDNSDLASNTIEKRKLCVSSFIEYTDNQNLEIETDNFYESVDQIREYFEQTKVHGTKVSAVRHFIEFIGTQVDSRTEDQLDDIKEKISMAKLKGKDEDVGQVKRKKIEKKLLTDEEIEAAKNAGSEKAELLIELMMDTAARPGEIVALTPADVDFEKGSFHINSTWSDASKSVQDYPKHESFRRVKVSRPVLERLEAYINSNEVGEKEQVFPSYRSHVYRPIKEAFTSAQVRVEGGTTRVTPHWLRHNACTRLIQNGNPKEKVQEYMGHSSIQITEVYEHFDDSQVVDVKLS